MEYPPNVRRWISPTLRGLNAASARVALDRPPKQATTKPVGKPPAPPPSSSEDEAGLCRREASWNQLFDGMDSMLNGESQKAFMDHIRRGSTDPLTDPATGRQTTGAAEELAERIARNQARQAAAEAEAHPAHPFSEAMNRVKEGAGAVKDSAEAIKETAGAVKEAAEAVSAVRDAGHAPAQDTVIIDRIHYVPFAVEPEAITLTSGHGQEPPALTDREWDVVKGFYRDCPVAEAEAARLNAARETRELPAPPDEGKPDQAA